MASESGLRKESKTWSRRGAQLAHTWLWFAGPSLSAPVISLEAQLRAPPLTFKIKDKILHDGALAANITRIGSGALRPVPFALYRVWFNRQESVTNSWRPGAGASGKPPLPAIPGAGASLEPGAAGEPGAHHAGPGPGVTGRASARKPPGALTSQPPIALMSPEALPVGARCAPWL